MCGLLELFIGGILLFCILGILLKLAGFVFSLILLPFKLLIAIGAALLTGALVIFLLPFTILAIVTLLGGLAIVLAGVASLVAL